MFDLRKNFRKYENRAFNFKFFVVCVLYSCLNLYFNRQATSIFERTQDNSPQPQFDLLSLSSYQKN